MDEDDKAIVSFNLPSVLQDLTDKEKHSIPDFEHCINQQQFHIRMANSKGRREAASLLIKKMYGWRGYASDSMMDTPADTPGRHSGAPALEAQPDSPMNKITLFAEMDGATVGTMTLCLDDVQSGLPADEIYHDKLDELRHQGCRLCEPSRLAIDKGLSNRVFAALIHISYIYAHNIHGYSDYVIEVNPRHVMFYKRMLGFKDFGEERECVRVGAPAVLLRLELDYMKQQIDKFGGVMSQNDTERSFYPHFFPSMDEPGITDRLIRGRN